jgi:uncharacterized repeat protein (TIGR01451 family)
MVFGLALAGLALARRRRALVAHLAGVAVFSAVLAMSSGAHAVTLPYSQNFDSFTNCSLSCFDGCALSEEWTNDAANQTDWRPDANGTISSGTGPGGDHTSGSGNYLYLETSGCNAQAAFLISPPLDLSVAGNPVATFWYHMYGATMGDLHIDVLDANKVSLKDDVVPLLSGNEDAWKKQSIDLNPYIGQTIHIRFRGITGSSFESDMAIDDFGVKDLLPDVGVTAIVSPYTGTCGDSQHYIQVEVTNFGAVVKDVPVEVTLGGAVIQVLNTTIQGDFGVGAVQKVQLGPVDLFAGGTLDIAATTTLSGDTNNANDAVSDQAEITDSAITVTPPSATVCPGKQAVFQAKLEMGANYEWFDDAVDGNLLGTGPVFAAPGSLMGTSYYVGRVPTVSSSVGPKDPLFGTTQYLIDQGGMVQFETLTDMTLDGVYVYPYEEGTVVVNLGNEFGAKTLATTSITISAGDVGNKTYVPLGFQVPAGKFTLNNSGTNIYLRFNSTNVSYPYTSPFLELQSCSIAGNSYPNLFIYFYDWQVSNFVCKPRTKIDVVADASLCDADLATQVSGPATAAAGGDIEYTIIIRNNGPTAAYGVSVTDTPPTGFTHVSNSGDCATAFPCDLDAIGAGESRNFKASYSLAPDVTGSVEFTATAASTSGDPDTSNNAGSAETQITSEGNLELKLSANAETIGVGAEVVFRLHAVNHGPATAAGTKINAEMPTGLSKVTTSGCDNDPGGSPLCQLGNIDPGGERVIWITATADSDAPRVVNYSATLSSDTAESAVGKETASVNIIINRGEIGEETIIAPRSPGCGCHVVGQQGTRGNRTPFGALGLGLMALGLVLRRRELGRG